MISLFFLDFYIADHINGESLDEFMIFTKHNTFKLIFILAKIY